MGLGLDLEGPDVRRLRHAVADACRRHGLLEPSADDEPYVDDLEAELELADELVAVELYPQERALFLDLSMLDDSPAASERFAQVLRGIVEGVIVAAGTVRESDGGATVDPDRIAHLVP